MPVTFRTAMKIISFAILLCGLCFVIFAQADNFYSIGTHKNKKARVQFNLNASGKIIAYLHEYSLTGFYPRSGDIVCEDLSAFPMEKIEKEVKKKNFVIHYFVVTYEVSEKIKTGVFHYNGKVTKAVPFRRFWFLLPQLLGNAG